MKLYITHHLNEYIAQLHKGWKHKERSWLVKVKKHWVDLIAYDIRHPKQKNSPAYTEFSNNPIDDLVAAGRLDEIEEFGIRLHSHNSMRAFWSGKDDQTRAEFETWGVESFVSLVTSMTDGPQKIGKNWYHCTLDVYKPKFSQNIQIVLWHPDCEIAIADFIKEQHAEYKKFEDEETQKLNDQIANDFTVLNTKYWITEEQFAEAMETKKANLVKTLAEIKEMFMQTIEDKKAELGWAWEMEAWLFFDLDTRESELKEAEEKPVVVYANTYVWGYNNPPKTWKKGKGDSRYREEDAEDSLFDTKEQQEAFYGSKRPITADDYAPNYDEKGCITISADEKRYKATDGTRYEIKFLNQWYYNRYNLKD